jgi:3-oxoacyl-[acyl-carrier protein] reductase
LLQPKTTKSEEMGYMDRLKGKVAVVTGSTSGIGIAKEFAAEGAHVVVCGRREGRGQEVVEQITSEGGSASFHRMDLTDLSTVDALMTDTVRDQGRIDILVDNAAGVGLKDGRVDEISLEDWDAMFASGVRGTFYAIKAALPYMREAGGGSIVNIGSMASISGDLGSTAYACSKAGVDMLTSYVALQYGKENIRCNCVRPGLIVTPQNEAHVPQQLKDVFLSNIEVNRYGNPADIAHACTYFASDESAYVTRQIINVDGGLNSHATTVAQFRSAGSRTW